MKEPNLVKKWDKGMNALSGAFDIVKGEIEKKEIYACSICGVSERNRFDWCDLGCGNDYNEMIKKS